MGRAAFGSPDTLGIPPDSEERMEVDSSKGTKRALTEADEEKVLESLLHEGRNMFLGNTMELDIIEPVCEEAGDQDQEFVDDISGEHLETSRVKETRKTEVELVEGMKVWKAVPRTKDMKVIFTRWVETNRGDKANPNYRSRFVARELKKDTLSELFAAMPPFAALKVLLSLAVTKFKPNEKGVLCEDPEQEVLGFLDVKRALLQCSDERNLRRIASRSRLP